MNRDRAVRIFIGLATLIWLAITFSIRDLLIEHFLIPSSDSLPNRAGVAQVVVEWFGLTITIVAGLVAVWEFRLSQLKPELDLFLRDEMSKELTKNLVWTKPTKEERKFFYLVLKNKGAGVATFIEVKIKFAGGDLWFYTRRPSGYHYDPNLAEPALQNLWKSAVIIEGETIFTFFGKDEIPCYGNDYSREIGRFQVDLFPDAKYSAQGYEVQYEMVARGFGPVEGKLNFTVKA